MQVVYYINMETFTSLQYFCTAGSGWHQKLHIYAKSGYILSYVKNCC